MTQTDELVDWLNDVSVGDEPIVWPECANKLTEAADLLVSQASEIARLRQALAPFSNFADFSNYYPDDLPISSGSPMAKRQLTMGDCRRARTALSERKTT